MLSLIKNSFLFLLAAIISSVIQSESLYAAQDSTTFEVRAQIEATCLIVSTQDIDFGTLIANTQAEYDLRGRIRYACSNGIRGRFFLDGGTTNGDVLDRAMQATDGSLLPYQLYTNRRYNRIWGDGTGASRSVRSAPGRGLDRPRNRNIFARILDTDLVNTVPGSYSDTITLTFEF